MLRTKGYTRLLDLSGEEQQGRYFEVPLCSVRCCLDYCSCRWAKIPETALDLAACPDVTGALDSTIVKLMEEADACCTCWADTADLHVHIVIELLIIPLTQGTGVLVLDRINAIAYVSLSERADRVCAGPAVASCLPPWPQMR